MYPLRYNQDPAPRLHCCFLAAPPLSLHPIPSQISNSLNLLFGTQGRSWRLKSIPYKQGTGDTERLLSPGAPQSPVQFQCHRIYVIMLFSEYHYICVYVCVCVCVYIYIYIYLALKNKPTESEKMQSSKPVRII